MTENNANKPHHFNGFVILDCKDLSSIRLLPILDISCIVLSWW